MAIFVSHYTGRRDFDIILPHRGNVLGLWATVHSCELELGHGNYNYGYVIISNGDDPMPRDLKLLLEFTKKTGKLVYHQHYSESLAPPTARDYGAFVSDADLLFFFDNHCLVTPGYFDRAVQDFKDYPDMDILHSTTRFWLNEPPTYAYRLTLANDFWGTIQPNAKYSDRPWQTAAGGHGGFVARQNSWFDLGGYWDGFKGYGGEEMYLDLKAWRYGKTVWIDPLLIHYHYAGSRGYARHYTDDYYINMMCCANIIGGEAWMRRVYESFTNYPRPKSKDKMRSMFDLMVEAVARSKAHAEFVNSMSIRTLDETLQYFRDNDIDH